MRSARKAGRATDRWARGRLHRRDPRRGHLAGTERRPIKPGKPESRTIQSAHLSPAETESVDRLADSRFERVRFETDSRTASEAMGKCGGLFFTSRGA